MRLLPVVKMIGGSSRNPVTEIIYYTLVDYEFFAYFSQFPRWVENSSGYVVRHEGKKTIYLHQEVARLVGFPLSEVVNHIDRNSRNNVKTNLEPATRSEDQANRGLFKNSTSGLMGVSWHKVTKKWQAQIMVRGKRIHLGLFDDKLEAARAYDRAVLLRFGPNATTNKLLGLIP